MTAPAGPRPTAKARVVVGRDPHVVITGQPGAVPPADVRKLFGQREHRAAVFEDRLGWPHTGRGMNTHVRALRQVSRFSASC